MGEIQEIGKTLPQTYMTYPDEQICYTLCINLSWSHNRLIMRVDEMHKELA